MELGHVMGSDVMGSNVMGSNVMGSNVMGSNVMGSNVKMVTLTQYREPSRRCWRLCWICA